MPRRAGSALIGAALLAGSLVALAAPVRSVDVLSEHVWDSDDPNLGGLSGLILAPDGIRFQAIGDRGFHVAGRLIRDAQGRIAGVQAGPATPLRDSDGGPLRGRRADAEDLAADPAGGVLVAFEGEARIARYPAPGARPQDLPRAPGFAALPVNSGLESLARTDDGTLYAIAEGAGPEGFPVFRLRNGQWGQPFALPRRGAFRPTAADIGPDGRLYVLERAFSVWRGFATRLRRFTLTPEGLTGEAVLAQSRYGEWDNMEALAIRRDAGGLVATLLSDDNYLPVQRRLWIELRLPEDAAGTARAD